MKINIKTNNRKKSKSHFKEAPNNRAAIDKKGAIGYYRTIALKLSRLSDIQKKTDNLSKKNEEHYKSLFENSLDGIYKSTIEGDYIDVNPSLVKMLGYDNKVELLSINIPNQIYVSKKYRLPLKEKNELFEAQLKKKDGTLIWVEVSARVINKEEKPAYYEGIVRNITERKKAEEKIVYLSFHDNLTGLYNRAYFEEEIKRQDTQRQLPLSFTIGDINRLKLVNDALGHLEGDRLIAKVAELLKAFCRKEDVIARWGGDEFTILLPKTKKENAEEIVNRIKNVCILTSKHKIPISISLGTATKEKINQDIKEVIIEAEDNMYRHKLIERKSIYSSIISSLERTLFEKSLETRDHAERLKKLSQEIGKIINLPNNKIDELSLLSTLHDIGKIALSEEILTSGRGLTKKEWILVKKHPEIGYNICESNPQLAHIAEGVLGHHEWWNGYGYPHSLKGENIPLTSRIISIVDAYDVMITGRTYKKAVTKKEALKELKRYAGKQFDPKLIDIFISIVSKYND